MATLTVQDVTGTTGIVPTYASADSAGDKFTNDGKTQFHVKNDGAASITATVDSPQKCSQGFEHDVAVAVAAGAEKIIGPFDKSRFNDTSGFVVVTYSAVTSVKVAALKTS